MSDRFVFLARHGETDWNAIGRLQGQTDIPLNEAGRAQARRLADLVRDARIGAIVTSDLARARETAEFVAGALGIVTAPHVDPDLRERGFGIFEGLTRDECDAHHPDAWRAWRERNEAPQGGEATPLAMERFDRAMQRVLAAARREAPILVVAHGSVMRIWLSAISARPLEPIGNAGLFRVTAGAPPTAVAWPEASR